MTLPAAHSPKHPAYRVWLTVPAAERDQRIQAVLQRYLADEKLADIAADIGISHSALNMALLEYAEEEWRNIQVARAMSRLDRANDEMDSAPDALSLARARERAKSAQWELERLLRRLYGQDQQAAAHAVQISINLRTAQPQAIDSTASLISTNPVADDQISPDPAG